MFICEYGCGQEAKHQLKNGKWCCSKSQNSCPAKRIEHSILMKSISWKEKKSNTMKELWKDPDSMYNSISFKEKQSKAQKKTRKNPNSKYKEKRKLTIKKIQQKYPTFSKEEELRYNPDKPGEKEIQVHCKNHNCPNSKEKDGWFTSTSSQIYNRANTIEKPKGFGECNFYCSQHCKDTCPCYKLRNDPLQLTRFQHYYKEVRKFTHLTLKYNFNKIPNIELRGKKHGYDLDHKFSIIDGFNNNIDPKVIGHWKNLEVIKAFDNRKKAGESSISIDEIQKIKKL